MHRKIDDLGRVVIPKEMRKKLEIADGDLLEISMSGNKIIMRKTCAGDDIKKMLESVIHGIENDVNGRDVNEMREMLEKALELVNNKA
jgi:transcriptional pleiotropic regulator of transition state genes